MNRRLISPCILFAFVHYIVGCISVETVSPEQAMQGKERVDRIVLQSGTTVQFDKKGGEVIGNYPGIRGISNGIPTFFSLRRIAELRTTSPPPIPETELNGGVIAEVVMTNQRAITFDKTGGVYEKDRGIISGRNVNGETLSIPKGRIMSLRATKPETMKAAEFLIHPDRVIHEVLIKTVEGERYGNLLVVFGPDGARYDNTTGVFVGKSTMGLPVEVPADEVLYATVKSTDTGLSIIAVAGVLLAGLLLFGVFFLLEINSRLH